MKTLHLVKKIVVCLLMVGPAWADEEDAREQAQAMAALAKANVTLLQAVQIAQKEVPDGKPVEAELQMKGDMPVYKVELLVGRDAKKVKICGMTGKVIKVQDVTAMLGLWDFDKVAQGTTPAGWSIKQNNPTKELGKWTVVADPTAPSPGHTLSLKTENGNATYNLAIVEKASVKDLDLSVRIKAHSGKDDQGGGLIWRCTDENNYYVCRINPLEKNYRLYKVVHGKRRQIQSVATEAAADQWHTLRVVMTGDHIRCYLNGKKMLDARDDTFKEAGRVGLWTKADACSSFDNLILVRAHEKKSEHRTHSETQAK